MTVSFIAMILGLLVLSISTLMVVVRPHDGRARREFDPDGFRSVWQMLRPKNFGKRSL